MNLPGRVQSFINVLSPHLESFKSLLLQKSLSRSFLTGTITSRRFPKCLTPTGTWIWVSSSFHSLIQTLMWRDVPGWSRFQLVKDTSSPLSQWKEPLLAWSLRPIQKESPERPNTRLLAKACSNLHRCQKTFRGVAHWVHTGGVSEWQGVWQRLKH